MCVDNNSTKIEDVEVLILKLFLLTSIYETDKMRKLGAMITKIIDSRKMLVSSMINGDKKRMKKYLLDCDAFRMKKTHSVTEGGMSRSLTIRNYLVNCSKYKAIEISGNSTISAFQVIWFFLRHFDNQIFVLYPTRFFLMGGNNKANRMLGNVTVKAFRFAAKRNRIIMDVSDIKYEQFIDLEIPCPDLSLIESREKAIFCNSVDFTFASGSMKEYAVEKYKIDEHRCEVCINGGRRYEESLNSEAITFKGKISNQHVNCVYAGTLNKGRMIDKMINSFKDVTSARLYLMGPMGEWIENYLVENEINNVIYLGAKDEGTAHQIVSQCDLGLIPYDEKRLYYNIAYPTKLSFYITAGISYISTPVKEVMKLHDGRIGYTGMIEEWPSILRDIKKEEIINKKKNVKGIRNEFTWEYILQNCKLMNV